MEERAPSIPDDDDHDTPAPSTPSPNTKVACVAVINHNNGPLFFKVYEHVAQVLPKRGTDNLDIHLQEVVYNSLDVIEERVVSLKSTPMRDNDGYLGCLGVVGPLSLYGYITNTRMKLVVAFKSTANNEHKDSAIKVLFRRLHKAVVTVFLNSFTPLDVPIKSRRFEAKVDEIANRFG